MIFKTTPWAHQQKALDFCLNLPQFMLAMDMGTGKSKVIVDTSTNLKAQIVLVVCPLTVVNVWPKEFARHGDGYNVVILEGPVEKKAKVAEQKIMLSKALGAPLVLVVNYDSAWRGKLGDLFLRYSGMFDLVVLDESHRIKSPSGVTSRYFAKLGKLCRRKICLTGTPMPHSPMDIYAQFRFLCPGVFGWSYQTFKMNYAVMGGYQGKIIVSFKNLPELKTRMFPYTYVVNKNDVLDLPEEIDSERVCVMEPNEKRVYDSMEKSFVAEVESGVVIASNALSKLLRLQQITSGYLAPDGNVSTVSYAKENALKDVLEDLPTNEPVVVFCRFHHDLDVVAAAAKSFERISHEVSGRKNELKEWQEAKGGEVLAVQIQSGGLGIDLTRARYSIYYSLGFSLGDYLQSRARLHRPGQTRAVEYFHLIVKDTVDEKVWKAIEKRQEIVNSVITSYKERG
jgi:SNF2 family DNA or RNA helicase